MNNGKKNSPKKTWVGCTSHSYPYQIPWTFQVEGRIGTSIDTILHRSGRFYIPLLIPMKAKLGHNSISGVFQWCFLTYNPHEHDRYKHHKPELSAQQWWRIIIFLTYKAALISRNISKIPMVCWSKITMFPNVFPMVFLSAKQRRRYCRRLFS